MTLDELLNGDEYTISKWMSEHALIHTCDCGYSVYDPDAVNEVVQAEWGDDRCNEIYDWACNLSNCYGWMFLESSASKHKVYHCQYCAESELSLLFDIDKIYSSSNLNEQNAKSESSDKPKLDIAIKERLVIYVDESYTPGFPRKEGDSLAYAALIVPKSAVGQIENEVSRIIEESYRGHRPKEIKYKEIRKSPRLLKRIGTNLVNLIHAIPNSAIVGLFVPQEGFFGERLRSIKAIAQYDGNQPAQSELEEVTSVSSVEQAVRKAGNILAQNLAACIASYIASRNANATIYFDPREKELDRALRDALKDFLPRIPVNVPLIRNGSTIVTSRTNAKMERLGNRVELNFDKHSHECPGLQIADFLTGDIRVFFEENSQFLELSTSSELLVNKHVLFPQVFKVGKVNHEIMKKVSSRSGQSFLPSYRTILANGLVSYYTKKGQMRNFDTQSGIVYDLVD